MPAEGCPALLTTAHVAERSLTRAHTSTCVRRASGARLNATRSEQERGGSLPDPLPVPPSTCGSRCVSWHQGHRGPEAKPPSQSSRDGVRLRSSSLASPQAPGSFRMECLMPKTLLARKQDSQYMLFFNKNVSF